MPNLKATAPADVAAAPDNSLPDPTSAAKLVLGVLFVIAFVLAVVANAAGWASNPFKPSADKTANFALFAGFYVAAQVIERLMEFVAPFLPWPGWSLPTGLAPAQNAANRAAALNSVTAAQLKADRAAVALGVTSVLGVAASFLFGLYFLKAVGISASGTVDTFITGVTISAGTKPLHDFISSLQNQSTPKTGTGA